MNNIDSTDRGDFDIEKELPVYPEHCENIKDFKEALVLRTEQINLKLDNNSKACKYADFLAEQKSADYLCEAKKNAIENSENAQMAFQDACFGNHEGMGIRDREKLIDSTKTRWEDCQGEVHLYDMTLERQNKMDGILEDTNEKYFEEREMDDVSRQQLQEKQQIIEDFCTRHEKMAMEPNRADEKNDAPTSIEKIENDEPSAFRKAVAIAGVAFGMYGMQTALTQPIEQIVTQPFEGSVETETVPPSSFPCDFAPDNPISWCDDFMRAFASLLGGEKTEIPYIEDSIIECGPKPPENNEDDRLGGKNR